MKRRRVVFRDEALEFFGGIHPVQFGAHCLRAKRFPFNIYYDVVEEAVVVLAILDMRQDPNQSLLSLQNR